MRSFADSTLGPGGDAAAPARRAKTAVAARPAPLVALFDPADGSHGRCVETLAAIEEPIATTVPVPTEAFHLLRPARGGSWISSPTAACGFSTLDAPGLERAFELMVQCADAPMDLTDASLVAMAEGRGLRTVFAIDRTDFAIYRIKRGHRYATFHMIG